MRLLVGNIAATCRFCRAVDPSVGPLLVPAIELALRFLVRFETQAVQLSLHVTDARFDLDLTVRFADAARQCGHAVVLEPSRKSGRRRIRRRA